MLSLKIGRSKPSLPVPIALTVIGLGAFFTALDQTVAVTVLPAVMVDLRLPISELDRASWIVTAYLLGYTVFMPLLGRLADVYGGPRVYLVGLGVFALGSVLVALSNSFTWIVGARTLQALGGAAAPPIGFALAAGMLPPERRGLALGLVGAAAEAGSMLGPVYGGAIGELLNWRWIFWLNLPQVALLLPGLLLLPNRRNPTARVDYWGGGLLAATLLILSLALSRPGLFSLTSAQPWLLAALGLLMIIGLSALERRVAHPLLLPWLFRSMAFVAANLTQLLVGVSLIIAMVTVPLLANTVMGKDVFTGALWLLRMTGAIPLGAMVGGFWLGRWPGRWGAPTVTAAGLLLTAVGLLLVSRWDTAVAEPELTFHLALSGLGFGLVIAPLMAQALKATPTTHWATVASLLVVARMLGMTLGLAALSAWGMEQFQTLTAGLSLPLPLAGEAPAAAAARLSDYLAQVNQAGLAVFHRFCQMAAAIALLALLPALLPALFPAAPPDLLMGREGKQGPDKQGPEEDGLRNP